MPKGEFCDWAYLKVTSTQHESRSSHYAHSNKYSLSSIFAEFLSKVRREMFSSERTKEIRQTFLQGEKR